MAEMKFIEGKRIYLRQMLASDADGPYPTWLNNARTCMGNSHHNYPYSREAARQYIESAGKAQDQLILAIVLNDGDQHIGNIALQSIHTINRSAELSILIGEQEVWGKGYGKEAFLLMMAHGFNCLNLHRLSCGTFSENHAMKVLAGAVGMSQEGVRRQAVFKEGKYLDVFEYGILAEEYFAMIATSGEQK